MANIYKNEMFALANTGTNLLYTVPSDTRAIIKTLQTVNIGANVQVTVEMAKISKEVKVVEREIKEEVEHK